VRLKGVPFAEWAEVGADGRVTSIVVARIDL
jgi:hypothetical protein